MCDTSPAPLLTKPFVPKSSGSSVKSPLSSIAASASWWTRHWREGDGRVKVAGDGWDARLALPDGEPGAAALGRL